MRALENRAIFSGVRHDRERQINEHKERLRTIKNVVDTSKPTTMETRCNSPSKKIIAKQAMRDRIVKDNLLLARKIFNIMEGNSDITDKINDSRHIDNHPGTMNFRQRLTEAQRIHERNMLLASRLDTVQPYYKVADLTIVKPTKKKVVHKSHNAKKSKFARELGLVLKADRAGNGGDLTHRSAGGADSAYKFSPVGDAPAQSQSARKPSYGADGADPESRTENQRTRPNNVLLEYTKIQDGRVLDVAVLKEPFRDRYAIFGIDVDDGQRYELRLTSDEVSSILDGDMLVTSVDNVEVWMALLNKVVLQKVGYFARLPFSAEEVDNINNKESGSNSPAGKIHKPLHTEESENDAYGEAITSHYTLGSRAAADVVATPPMSPNTAAAVKAAGTSKSLVPTAPSSSRPSTDRPVSRAASGGAVAGTAVTVTSAAGAVRGRHLKSGGGGGQAGAQAQTQAQVGSGLLLSGDNPIDDTILSLFADAGLGVEVDRLDVVTPGFMDNATSAMVTLVQANADFPDAPEGLEDEQEQEGGDILQKENMLTEDAPIVAGTSKKIAPSKPRVLKSGGSTKAAALRAAAVRRRSIESEQTAVATKQSAATAQAPVPPKGGAPAVRKSSVTASKPSATPKAEAAKPVAPTKIHVTPTTSHKPVDVPSSGTAATTTTAPRAPSAGDPSRPKSSRGLSAPSAAPAATNEVRPKSGALAPKVPASTASTVGASGARPGSKGVTHQQPQQQQQGKATPSSPNAAKPKVAPSAASSAAPTAIRQRAIEETKRLVQDYVANAINVAIVSALRNSSPKATKEVVAEEESVVQEELSALLKEGSRMTKSVAASEVDASGLEYSMDFERSA